MVIEVNGGLRMKKGGYILTVYSFPFARYLQEKNIKRMGVKFSESCFEIYPGTEEKIHLERVNKKTPICVIHVGRLLPRGVKDMLIAIKKQKSVKVIVKNFLEKEQLIKYNKRIVYKEPKKQKIYIPKSDLVKVGCFISCFRKNNASSYRFNIRHRILEEIAMKKDKIRIHRDNDKFYMGLEFKLYKNKKGHPLTYLMISPSLLNKTEKELFKKRRCISFKAFLSKKEFDLDISKYLTNKEERELAYALLRNKINIRIPEMRKREADIVIEDNNSQIEITRIMPRKNDSSKNNAHSEGIHINGRLCEGFVRVTRENINKFFVVFHKEWIQCGWVRELCKRVGPRVIAIPTDFLKNWAEDVANKIKINIKNDKKAKLRSEKKTK
jgi:hypothetical protein